MYSCDCKLLIKRTLIFLGLDSLAQIGMPPSESGGQDNLGKQHQVAHYDSWKRDFDRYFPPASGPGKICFSYLLFFVVVVVVVVFVQAIYK